MLKFKLDENLGVRLKGILTEMGFDVETVMDEGMLGASDESLFKVCCEEERCLITLDLDFADIVRYPPESASGIIILRVPGSITLSKLEAMARSLTTLLQVNDPKGSIWIVSPGNIRIRP